MLAMARQEVSPSDFFWLLQSLCTLHGRPFTLGLAQQQFAAPYSIALLVKAAQALGMELATSRIRLAKLHRQPFPLIVWLRSVQPMDASGTGPEATSTLTPVLLLQADEAQALILKPGTAMPQACSLHELGASYSAYASRVTPQPIAGAQAADAEDEADHAQRRFGFAWFLPEILKHRRLWQEILLASLVIQLIALATPLFTQTIIDKVIVHHTQGTLLVIGVAMAIFVLFSSVLGWLRQYLVLHTGRRIDAALGAAVFERLFKLPPLYFQYRPTGVISARLQGIETIREFIASAAVTLILDFPFLLIFVAVMLYYSVPLTLIVLAILCVIVLISAASAPLFQRKLQKQFQCGARNQAFLTEYIAGMETVKSLQLEPQLGSRYGGLLSDYLSASFDSRQLANSYNTAANALEQLMTLLVLVIGAHTVMRDSAFTIGMLVAFQMFAGRLSQPMLRIVGLWQQFQQARLAVDRLGDLMNAPMEPYTLLPARQTAHRGDIQIEALAFRYGEKLPLVYQNLNLHIRPGQLVALMGASGCGKSTLTRLLQGFYQPSAGRILIDGIDSLHLSANALRSLFGVVPQETVLFCGSIHHNLLMANPHADFEQIVTACKMAGIHDAIEAQPMGYQTELGERGAGLSGGQRQRLAIARALLKRAPILIFDEAASALDGPAAEQFAHTVNSLKGRVTMLFIAHSLPGSLQVDAVYRLTATGAQALGAARPAASPDPVQ